MYLEVNNNNKCIELLTSTFFMLTSLLISYFARLNWLTASAECIVKEKIDYVLTNGTKGKIG